MSKTVAPKRNTQLHVTRLEPEAIVTIKAYCRENGLSYRFFINKMLKEKAAQLQEAQRDKTKKIGTRV
jgi:predicted DNA binding CopG/RHH family protein